ncbi:MAG: F0F1 ATP synthase subunit A [bacterium]
MPDIQTNAVDAANLVQMKSEAVQSFMMHHVMDSHSWAWLPHLHTPLPEPLTVHAVMMIAVAILLIVVLGITGRRKQAVPTGLLNAVEFFAKYIRDEMVIPFLGEHDGRKMAPMFCTLFFFILIMNLVGLIPCFYTATANLGVTAALALVTLSFMIFGGIYRNGFVAFCKGFAPPGIPGPMLLMIVPIEIVSMFIRAMALAIRLFANMLAGHLVIYSLLGMIVMFGFYAAPALLGALGIYLLEVFVSFLQAYIFTLLSAIFIGERYHPAH